MEVVQAKPPFVPKNRFLRVKSLTFTVKPFIIWDPNLLVRKDLSFGITYNYYIRE